MFEVYVAIAMLRIWDQSFGDHRGPCSMWAAQLGSLKGGASTANSLDVVFFAVLAITGKKT